MGRARSVAVAGILVLGASACVVPDGEATGDGALASSKGKGAGKVTVCHAPPGNPGNAHEISVGAPAVAAHLGHGDWLGSCVLADDLFFSEYGEPPALGFGNDKYLEIYNHTGAAVDLSDYAIHRGQNGAAFPGLDFPLSGTLAHGDTLVVCNAQIGALFVADCDVLTGTVLQNGNDAVGLVKNGNLIDSIGEFGVDPGSAGWTVCGVAGGTSNSVLTRQPDVTAPNTNWGASSSVAGCEWIVGDGSSITPYLANSSLGTHNYNP